jgi:Tfp pilus assembly protein PilV
MGIVQHLIPLATESAEKNLQMNSSSSACRRVMAFTMLEVMLAVLVVSVTFAGFYLCLSQGFASTEMNREDLRATQLLQQQMETIRLYTWSQINSNGFIPATFTAPFNAVGIQGSNAPVYTGYITITNAPMTESYATNHVLVTVLLKWNSGNGNQPHSRQMSTIVSQYGLHNYFY